MKMVRERRGEYHRVFGELKALAPVIAGTQVGVAQLTDLTPAFDGVDPAPLVELRLALHRWRRVRWLQEEATDHPDAVLAFVDAQPRACPLAWQPVGFFAVVLGSGWLLHALGRLAPCARVFGARRGRALWGQRRGLSMCEALARLLCVRLDPADARAGEMRLCVSAGQQLLRLAIQPDHENTAHYHKVVAAARLGVEALREARAWGASVNARRANKPKRATAIMAASFNGEIDAVKNLIAMRAALDLQAEGDATAILMAAHNGHAATVTALTKAGAALDLQNADGWTAIMCAARNGHTAIVTALIGAGAALDLQNKNGDTAIARAARNGHTAIVTALIGAGAALDLQNKNGWTVIARAACDGHAGIVTALIGAGAALDLQDSTGWTAIMHAALCGHLAIVTALIDAGAALDLQNNDGWTAIMFARMFARGNANPAIVEILDGTGDRAGYDWERLECGGEFLGVWQAGVMHGHGVMRYTNGDVYIGAMEQNARHGEGQLSTRGGEVYRGGWRDGLRHGPGIHITPDGVEEPQQWLRGAQLTRGAASTRRTKRRAKHHTKRRRRSGR